jgi:hypothetical protein
VENEAVRAWNRSELRAAADPVRGAAAQAYMKSAIPSLGVRVPDVRRTAKAVAAAHPFETADDLRSTVLVLWRDALYREERYAAIDLTGLQRGRRPADASGV